MTKLTTGQIKSLCEVTDGWEYSPRYINYPGGLALTRKCLKGEHDLWNTLLLPLLLSQACDALGISIVKHGIDGLWTAMGEYYESDKFDTPNEARIQALKEALKENEG